MPKVIFKPSGEIIALWDAPNPNPKNNYSGLVYHTQSLDKRVIFKIGVPRIKPVWEGRSDDALNTSRVV
jgi:hypothetical protein